MRKARLLVQACAPLLLIVLLGTPTAQAQISVSIPALTAGVGETITVPVDISGIETSGPFSSYQFQVVTSNSSLEFTGIDETSTLSTSSGWFASGNSATGVVGGFSSSLDAIDTSGTLVNLVFQLNAVDPGVSVELHGFKIQIGLDPPRFSDPAVPSTQFIISTDAEDETTIPGSFVLRGNYPNPFNPTTNIRFDLPQTSEVDIAIMDILGREMMTIPTQTLAAGAGQTVNINAESLSSGIYIYRVVARSANDMKVASGTMTLIK